MAKAGTGLNEPSHAAKPARQAATRARAAGWAVKRRVDMDMDTDGSTDILTRPGTVTSAAGQAAEGRAAMSGAGVGNRATMAGRASAGATGAGQMGAREGMSPAGTGVAHGLESASRRDGAAVVGGSKKREAA
jgi:hypothetical protein